MPVCKSVTTALQGVRFLPGAAAVRAQTAAFCWEASPWRLPLSWGTPLGSGAAQQGRSCVLQQSLSLLQRDPRVLEGPTHCCLNAGLMPSWSLLSVLIGGPLAVAAAVAAVVAPLA